MSDLFVLLLHNKHGCFIHCVCMAILFMLHVTVDKLYIGNLLTLGC
jgi:hypothetical protein